MLQPDRIESYWYFIRKMRIGTQMEPKASKFTTYGLILSKEQVMISRNSRCTALVVFKERRMLKDRFLAVCSAVIFYSVSVWAQGLGVENPLDSEQYFKSSLRTEVLSSPSASQVFYEIASELSNCPEITEQESEQTIVLLNAAERLDPGNDRIKPLLIRVACKHTLQDHTEQVTEWLSEYISTSIDYEVVKEAVQYLLDRANSREQREQLLEDMLANLSGKHPIVDSELSLKLVLLKAEKGDMESARFYMLRAYDNNRYNKLAFAKLAELTPEQVNPLMYLEHLRLVLRENPLDMEAALNFARFAERLQLCEIAGGAYEYCADLFNYLYPSEDMPTQIYLPWAICSYNTPRSELKCLRIANQVRKTGRFDILLEAIAGKAAEKSGNSEEANRIFRAAEQKAQELLEKGPVVDKVGVETDKNSYSPQIGAKQFAWFYCFASQDAASALDWANKAYSTEPNSPAAAAILAYALLMNDQLEWAKPLIESHEHTQIADLVQAAIQLAEGEKEKGIKTLKSVINRDPGSMTAECAKQILSEHGSEYVPPIDPDVVLTVLSDSLGQHVIPKFTSPYEAISVQFSIRGNKFSYGAKFNGIVAIVNNSAEPLVVSDDGLFRGNIRIDANISGDINRKIPNLVSRKIRTDLLVEPKRGILTTVPLVVGELKRILMTYPQASLSIEFVLYLDPAITPQNRVSNRLVDIKPATIVVTRSGIELSGEYLRNRFNSISIGQTGQKIKTAELFLGLLKEQHAMAEQGTLYRFKYADWMPELLKSAFLHESGLLLHPADGEWEVKVHTMSEMLDFSMDHELISAVAENLSNTKWPVRMMVVYLLAKNSDQQFAKVLDWVSKYDSEEFVRNMARSLGGSSVPSVISNNMPLSESSSSTTNWQP